MKLKLWHILVTTLCFVVLYVMYQRRGLVAVVIFMIVVSAVIGFCIWREARCDHIPGEQSFTNKAVFTYCAKCNTVMRVDWKEQS